MKDLEDRCSSDVSVDRSPADLLLQFLEPVFRVWTLV